MSENCKVNMCQRMTREWFSQGEKLSLGSGEGKLLLVLERKASTLQRYLVSHCTLCIFFQNELSMLWVGIYLLVCLGFFKFFSLPFFYNVTLHTNVFPGHDQWETHISTNTCRHVCLSMAHMLLLVCSQKPSGSHVRIMSHTCPFRRAFVLQPKLPWILYQRDVFHF